jgi:hypothetical protein
MIFEPYESATAALDDLCRGFFDAAGAPPCEPVEPESLPNGFRRLLWHGDEMTCTLAAYHDCEIELRVLAHRQDEGLYRRKIALVARPTGRIVELGAVRLNPAAVPPAAAAEILERRRPLGEILIRHQVERRIRPRWFLRLPASGPPFAELAASGPYLYGRIASIECRGVHAVDLLEVVTTERGERRA